VLRSRFAGGVTGVSGRLLFGLQRAFTFSAFGLGALGLNRSVAFGLLCTFSLTDFAIASPLYVPNRAKEKAEAACKQKGKCKNIARHL
jgi:hypothetical protein